MNIWKSFGVPFMRRPMATFARRFANKKPRWQAGLQEVIAMSRSMFAKKGAVVNPAMDIPLRKSLGFEEVGVTPDLAQHWLTFNVANCVVKQAKVNRYREEMERGAWNYQFDPLRFAPGQLLDGQHRLMAIVLSGVKQTMLVAYGLDPETQSTMDTGRQRTPRDVLSIEGLQTWESGTLGTAIHRVMAVASGLPLYSTKRFLNHEVRDFYLEHEHALTESVEAIKPLPRKRAVIAPSQSVALHYLFAGKDREKADLFFERLLTGNDLTKTSPIFHLRERLLNDVLDKRKRPVRDQLYSIVKAWNAFRAGRQLRSQQTLRPQGDSFPEIQ